MADQKNVLDGFLFLSEEQFARAKKEKEMIEYLTANTESSDMKAWLKIYNKSVEKNSFQTVIGQQFLSNLQRKLTTSQLVSADTLAPIRAVSFQQTAPRDKKGSDAKPAVNGKAEHYKKLYENATANQKIKNMAIGMLICVIIGMFLITGFSRYSVFTYFTNYEDKIREQVTDEMKEWQAQLEEKEKELNESQKN